MRSIPDNTMIAFYDAVQEMAHFTAPSLLRNAQALGLALGRAGIGGVTRSGSPLAAAALHSLYDTGSAAIMLSPAAGESEHTRSYRLPRAVMPTVYTGRGALGADVVALMSSKGIVILGADEEALSGILGCAEGHGLPLVVLTDAPPAEVRAVVSKRYPQLLQHVFVSADPALVAKHLSEELRRRQFSQG